MSVIYKITCSANQKFYIGSTVNKNQRFARHRKELRNGTHKNKNMQASWNKYGEATFLFEVVEFVDDANQLMVVEQRYLDTCVGKEDCFNHNKFADCPWRGKSGEGTPNWGKKLSPERLKQMSGAASGERNACWGKPVPEERKERIRQANLLYPHYLNRHTDEAKAKISMASKARVQTEEEKEKRRQSMMGHEVSTLTRMKISKTLSGEGNYWYGKKRPDSFSEQISRAVIAMDPSGIATTYKSIKQAMDVTGLLPSTINRSLKSGKPLSRGPFVGWSFKYA